MADIINTGGVSRQLASRLTGGCMSGLARLLGVDYSTVKRWNSGRAEPSPIAALLLALLSVLSKRLGSDDAARDLVVEAARRLGRKPEDLRK